MLLQISGNRVMFMASVLGLSVALPRPSMLVMLLRLLLERFTNSGASVMETLYLRVMVRADTMPSTPKMKEMRNICFQCFRSLVKIPIQSISSSSEASWIPGLLF